MKIGIDISQIIYGTGVSHYTEKLVQNLLKIDKNNEYLLYGGSLRRFRELKVKSERLMVNSNATTKIFPIPPRMADMIWNKLHILPIENLIGRVDVIHTSDWAESPSRVPKVSTVHDLAPLKFSQVTPKIIVETHKERLKWVNKESNIIIVPSIATKNDLIELGFNEEKIRVIYESFNHKKASLEEVERVRAKYGIREDYILSVGVNPRKNIQRSIEAFNLAKSGHNIKYLIVGPESGSNFKDERGVRFLGYVPDADLEGLITGAKVEVFTSLYEGFGVPILDAFNCETPIVTSNISSMPEAAGGAAILVDPYDVNSIADGIKEALTKPKTLIAKGLKRVADFSWIKTAEETLKVYKEASENNI